MSSISKMTLGEYLSISYKQFLFIYIDYSILQWFLQLSRIAFMSTILSYIIYVSLLIVLIMICLFFLNKINSPQQYNIEYRSRMGYYFLLDKNYYLNYLDFLYDEERL